MLADETLNLTPNYALLMPFRNHENPMKVIVQTRRKVAKRVYGTTDRYAKGKLKLLNPQTNNEHGSKEADRKEYHW